MKLTGEIAKRISDDNVVACWYWCRWWEMKKNKINKRNMNRSAQRITNNTQVYWKEIEKVWTYSQFTIDVFSHFIFVYNESI